MSEQREVNEIIVVSHTIGETKVTFEVPVFIVSDMLLDLIEREAPTKDIDTHIEAILFTMVLEQFFEQRPSKDEAFKYVKYMCSLDIEELQDVAEFITKKALEKVNN